MGVMPGTSRLAAGPGGGTDVVGRGRAMFSRNDSDRAMIMLRPTPPAASANSPAPAMPPSSRRRAGSRAWWSRGSVAVSAAISSRSTVQPVAAAAPTARAVGTGEALTSPTAAAMPSTANPPNVTGLSHGRRRLARPIIAPMATAMTVVPMASAPLSAVPNTLMAKSLTKSGEPSTT